MPRIAIRTPERMRRKTDIVRRIICGLVEPFPIGKGLGTFVW